MCYTFVEQMADEIVAHHGKCGYICGVLTGKVVLYWSSIFVILCLKNLLYISCFKWYHPVIVRMRSDMVSGCGQSLGLVIQPVRDSVDTPKG